jgi:hypothetical protein
MLGASPKIDRISFLRVWLLDEGWSIGNETVAQSPLIVHRSLSIIVATPCPPPAQALAKP